MHPELEKLIEMALADGQVTDKEREIILRKAEKLGLDRDEVEMYLEGSLDEKKQDNSSKLIEGVIVNFESKTLKSVSPSVRNFTPREVIQIKPAQLNKENEIELKISELSKNKKTLFNNLEELVDEIRISHIDLVKIKSSFDKQLTSVKEDFKKNANTNLGKFINEINKSIAKKFDGGKLIFDKPEDFIGLDFLELTNLIKTRGLWSLYDLQSKRIKYRLFVLILLIPSVYYIYINMIDYEYIKNSGKKILLGFGIGISLVLKAINLSQLIADKKANFSDSDLNPIIREVRRKYSKEFDELLRLKNEIIRLELIQKNLKLKDIAVYEKFLKTK